MCLKSCVQRTRRSRDGFRDWNWTDAIINEQFFGAGKIRDNNCCRLVGNTYFNLIKEYVFRNDLFSELIQPIYNFKTNSPQSRCHVSSNYIVYVAVRFAYVSFQNISFSQSHRTSYTKRLIIWASNYPKQFAPGRVTWRAIRVNVAHIDTSLILWVFCLFQKYVWVNTWQATQDLDVHARASTQPPRAYNVWYKIMSNMCNRMPRRKMGCVVVCLFFFPIEARRPQKGRMENIMFVYMMERYLPTYKLGHFKCASTLFKTSNSICQSSQPCRSQSNPRICKQLNTSLL